MRDLLQKEAKTTNYIVQDLEDDEDVASEAAEDIIVGAEEAGTILFVGDTGLIFSSYGS